MAKQIYTDEMVSFLRKHSKEMTRKELTELFNHQFGTDLSQDSIQWVCKSRKIKGTPAFTKGMKSPYNATKYKIGDEFFMAGEWRVLTSTEPNKSILARSEYKKRVIWMNAYGEIPKGYCFIYLDGDKRNCELDNLACIPLMWMRVLNQNGWLNKDKEITITALKWCELHYQISIKDGDRYVKANGQRWRNRNE